jgi:hypothetical protein
MAVDAAGGALGALLGLGPRTDRLAAAGPRRRVLVLAVYRPGSLLPAAVGRLRSTRHELDVVLGATGRADSALAGATAAEQLGGGKLENVDRLLSGVPETGRFDWTLVLDDDVLLPRRFLDRFIALCEAFALDLAQPAQTWRGQSAWRVTRRRPASLVRETRFVEIGPVTAFRRRAAAELLPFPGLRYGWGLDLHWAALARERGWRLGVVDATPVHHPSPVAAAYGHAPAIAEAGRFLAGRPFLPADAAAETLATHRRIPG